MLIYFSITVEKYFDNYRKVFRQLSKKKLVIIDLEN